MSDFTDAVTSDLAIFFNSNELAKSASYKDMSAGTTTSITAIPETLDGQEIILSGYHRRDVQAWWVQTSEVSSVTVHDEIIDGTDIWEIVGVRKDSLGNTLRLLCVLQG